MSKPAYLSKKELKRLLDRIDALEKSVHSLLNLFNPEDEDWLVRPIFPKGVIPDQEYYYTDEWTAIKAEADEDIRLGRYVSCNSVEDARRHLKQLMEEPNEVPIQ